LIGPMTTANCWTCHPAADATRRHFDLKTAMADV
jgi:hypothetical protein